VSAKFGGQEIPGFFPIKRKDFLCAVVFRETLERKASRFQLASGVLSSRLQQSGRLTNHLHPTSDECYRIKKLSARH